MNKIHSIYRKTRVLSQLPLEFFPSLTPPITSDTNMGTKGNFLYRIPSPLISLCSQLAHMVRIDVCPNFHLSFPSSHKLFNYLYKPSQHRSQQTGGCVHT